MNHTGSHTKDIARRPKWNDLENHISSASQLDTIQKEKLVFCYWLRRICSIGFETLLSSSESVVPMISEQREFIKVISLSKGLWDERNQGNSMFENDETIFFFMKKYSEIYQSFFGFYFFSIAQN